MADINHVITLGIGTPADIPHFILFGLSPVAAPAFSTGLGITLDARARQLLKAAARHTLDAKARQQLKVKIEE